MGYKMAKSKVRKTTKKKTTKVNPAETIISSLKNKCKNTKPLLTNEFYYLSSIDNYISELVYSVGKQIDEQVTIIQNKELEVASEILYEQYENELITLEIAKKIMDEELELIKCLPILQSKINKRIEAVNYFSKKSYNSKPKDFIRKVVLGIYESDAILKALSKNVPKQYSEYVIQKFFEELENYHTQKIQTKINRISIDFSMEVESLNRIVEESEEILTLLIEEERNKDNSDDNDKNKEQENNIEKEIVAVDVNADTDNLHKEDKKHEKENISRLRNQVEENIKFIKNKNRLRGTYKQIQEFAKKLGFYEDRQRGTSHLIFSNGTISVPIPNKKGDIKPGLLSAIIKQLGSSRDKYMELMF